jgi:hypothetical protein
LNITSTNKKETNKFKYTGKIIKEIEESKIRDDNYIDTSNYIDIRKVEFGNLDYEEEEVQIITTNNTNPMNLSLKTLTLRNKNTMAKMTSREEKKPMNNKIASHSKVRPVSEYKNKDDTAKPNLLRTLNKTNINLNNTFNTNVNTKIRPKSSYKKPDIELKLNEASLSTEASSVFRGRIEDYAIGKEIGKGAYAIVKLAHHKPTNKKMAIKIYEKVKLLDNQRKNSVKREIQILKKLDHLNIVKLNEVIDNTKQVNICIIILN